MLYYMLWWWENIPSIVFKTSKPERELQLLNLRVSRAEKHKSGNWSQKPAKASNDQSQNLQNLVNKRELTLIISPR